MSLWIGRPQTCSKNNCARAGVIAEVRKREAYEKPSVRRKKKSEAADASVNLEQLRFLHICK
jgi:hypothetical protein